MKEIEELNTILEIIVNDREYSFITFEQIVSNLKHRNIKPEYLTAQLKKLIKDGYVTDDKTLGKGSTLTSVAQSIDGSISEPETIEIDKLENVYWPTWEGIFFVKTGGYVQQFNDATSSTQRIEFLEKHTFRATVWMAFGAVSLVILELYKIYYQVCKDIDETSLKKVLRYILMGLTSI